MSQGPLTNTSVIARKLQCFVLIDGWDFDEFHLSISMKYWKPVRRYNVMGELCGSYVLLSFPFRAVDPIEFQLLLLFYDRILYLQNVRVF